MQNCFHIQGSELRPGVPFFNCQLWENFRGHVVGLDTGCLEFGEYAPGLHLFPGGEWHSAKPHWWKSPNTTNPQHRRQERDKREIWLIAFNCRLVMADRNNGLRFLRSMPSGLEIAPPEPSEAAKYLYDRAVTMQASGGRGLNWVRQSLVAIKNKYGGKGVSEHLAQLKKL